jgi:hypothetical protein
MCLKDEGNITSYVGHINKKGASCVITEGSVKGLYVSSSRRFFYDHITLNKMHLLYLHIQISMTRV